MHAQPAKDDAADTDDVFGALDQPNSACVRYEWQRGDLSVVVVFETETHSEKTRR